MIYIHNLPTTSPLTIKIKKLITSNSYFNASASKHLHPGRAFQIISSRIRSISLSSLSGKTNRYACQKVKLDCCRYLENIIYCIRPLENQPKYDTGHGNGAGDRIPIYCVGTRNNARTFSEGNKGNN